MVIVFLFIFYAAMVAILTVYHADHFSEYTHMKGYETLNYVILLFLSSVLFQLLVAALLKSFRWKGILFSTMGNIVVSTLIGLFIISTLPISGVPRHLIIVYGCCYLTIFAVSLLVQVKRAATPRGSDRA